MWKVHLESLIRFGFIGYRVYVGRENHDGTYTTMENPIFIDHPPHSFADEKSAFIDDSRSLDSSRVDARAFLQAMSDAAWEIGIKPKQIEDHTSELKATKYHLEDMRTLALK